MVDPQATASLTPAVRGSDTPDILGYELLRMLGSGGMGRVWRARQRSVGRDVALKILDPHLGADPSYAERFLREARAAASVHHPNVCACFDAGESDGRQYLALEFVAGGDAAELIRRRGGRLGIEESVALACDCARGLEAIAAAGLIHRDIKPSNILLTADPTAGGVAKLGDFGLARPADPEARLTRTGAALGTPAYMAPEQARGERSIDIRADIYALGASLFEMLTGEPPFAGDTAYAVVSQVLKGPTPDPRQRNRKVSPALSAVVMRAMARAPAERYANPTELRLDLERLIRNELPLAFLATAGANLATGILTRPAAAARAPAAQQSSEITVAPPRTALWRAAAIAFAIGTLGLGVIMVLANGTHDDGAGAAGAPSSLPPLPSHPAPAVTSVRAAGPFGAPAVAPTPLPAPAPAAAPAPRACIRTAARDRRGHTERRARGQHGARGQHRRCAARGAEVGVSRDRRTNRATRGSAGTSVDQAARGRGQPARPAAAACADHAAVRVPAAAGRPATAA